MRRQQHGGVWLLAGLLMSAVAGCGDGLARVSGNVTLDGEPLAGRSDVRGTVYLYPEGGSGAPAVGVLDSEGGFTVATGSKKGVAPGPYVVTVSATQILPPRIEGDAPGGRPITPRRYADPTKSGLRVEVQPGSNEFDFALESRE